MGNVVSKLLKLKEWVTIPDAARHLSQILSEPVSEADILQMALDGNLKMSVHFPNHAYARIGRVMPYKNVPFYELPALDGSGMVPIIDGYPLYALNFPEPPQPETPFVHFDKEVIVIDGLWDMAMSGNERTDIESSLQRLIGGPTVIKWNPWGTFLNRSDGTWADLRVPVRAENIGDEEGGKTEEKCSYRVTASLQEQECNYVVRTSEILALQSKLNGSPLEKPLANRERVPCWRSLQPCARMPGTTTKSPQKPLGSSKTVRQKWGFQSVKPPSRGTSRKSPKPWKYA